MCFYAFYIRFNFCDYFLPSTGILPLTSEENKSYRYHMKLDFCDVNSILAILCPFLVLPSGLLSVCSTADPTFPSCHKHRKLIGTFEQRKTDSSWEPLHETLLMSCSARVAHPFPNTHPSPASVAPKATWPFYLLLKPCLWLCSIFIHI
jgi:hypothetical protein